MPSLADIKANASILTANERAALASWLIASLEDNSGDENDIDTAWRHEIRARVKAIQTNRVKMIPASEMWEELWKGHAKIG